MGFMDRMKEAASKAQETASQLGEAAKEGTSPETAAMADDINRIGHHGIETKAILKSMTATSGKKLGGGTEYAMEVEVQPPDGGAPYPVTITQQLIEQSVQAYEGMMGGEIVVKVDPNDPNKVVLWG